MNPATPGRERDAAVADAGALTRDPVSPARYLVAVGLLCLFYLVIQLVYIERLPLAPDEFASARAGFRLGEEVPYRDFRPYKTVLGYYVQLPVLLLNADPWSGLLWTKREMALLNTAAICLAAACLARRFRREAVLLALGLLVTMSTFLERSSDLRVDMMTSLAGCASLLLLLGRRPGWAGLAAGLSFLVSQKGIYYLLAGGAALAVAWLVRGRRPRELRGVVAFGLAAAGIVVAYLAGWAAVSSGSKVFAATFLSHGDIALKDVYRGVVNVRGYWWQTVRRNPFFYGLAVWALVRLLRDRRAGKREDRALLLVVYGTVVLALGLWHRQPWPYFFVLLIPTFSVLHASYFDAVLESAAPGRRRLALPLLVLYLGAGVAWPVAGRLPRALERDSGFQRHMVRLADALLDEGETYLAGVDLLYRRRQAVPALAWLDLPQLQRLRGMTTDALDGVIADLERTPPKLVVLNYRFQNLPRPILDYLRQRYRPFWGSMLLYGRRAAAGEAIDLAFGGAYRVLVAAGIGAGRIGGRAVRSGDVVLLERGRYRNDGEVDWSLSLWPADWEALADPTFKEPQELFPRVYEF